MIRFLSSLRRPSTPPPPPFLKKQTNKQRKRKKEAMIFLTCSCGKRDNMTACSRRDKLLRRAILHHRRKDDLSVSSLLTFYYEQGTMYLRRISTCINVNLIYQLYFQLLCCSHASLLTQTDTNGHLDIHQLTSSYFYGFISARTHPQVLAPSIAQLVERRTVETWIDILRSLVRIRLEGIFFQLFLLLL